MRPILILIAICCAALIASEALAGHKCMPAAGLSDLTTTTCVINSANTGTGRKFTTRDCADTPPQGFSYEFTWPEGGVVGVDLAMYTLGVATQGNASYDMDADVAAGDLNGDGAVDPFELNQAGIAFANGCPR